MSDAQSSLERIILGLFENTGVASLIVAPNGQVLAANQRARSILKADSVLRIDNGHLDGGSREHSRQLGRPLSNPSVRTRVHPFPGVDGQGPGLVLAIRRVAPDSSLIYLRVRQPSPPPLQRLGPIASAYGLTIRETRMLRLLVSGNDVREAAQAMSVSVSTARTFVKHIYLKLDVRNRQQIGARVLGYWAFDD